MRLKANDPFALWQRILAEDVGCTPYALFGDTDHSKEGAQATPQAAEATEDA